MDPLTQYLSLPPQVRDSAAKAVDRLERRKGEDLTEWATRLARDLSRIKD